MLRHSFRYFVRRRRTGQPLRMGLFLASILLAATPQPALALSGKGAMATVVAEVWPRIKGLLLAAVSQLTPPEGKAWLWPFMIGVFWLLFMNKGLRAKLHWVAYITPPVFPLVPGWWLLSHVPIIGGLFKWCINHLWTPVMGFGLGSWGTVRELTMGAFGCAIIAGFLGGNWIHLYFGWSQYLFLVPLGVAGFITFLLFVAEKVGGKAFRDKVARAGAPGRLWLRLRHGVSEADQYRCPGRRRGRVCGHVNPITVRHCGACGAANPRATWDCQCGKEEIPHTALHCPACGEARPRRPGAPPPAPPAERPPAAQAGEAPAPERGLRCAACGAQEVASATHCGACGRALRPPPRGAAPRSSRTFDDMGDL